MAGLRFFKTLVFTVVSLWLLAAQADIFDLNQNSTDPLPAAEAFKFSATRDGDTVTATWSLAPGYYLYKDRFKFMLQGHVLKGVVLPPAREHADEVLGHFDAYSDHLNVTLPLDKADKDRPVQLSVFYQGCSENHFCYPPMQATLKLPVTVSTPIKATLQNEVAPSSEIAPAPVSLGKYGLWLNLLSFFGVGLLLAFTPCILPMIPILSGIIIGHSKISTRKAFWISLTYVLSMALTYAMVGVLAGYAGENLQTALQTPLAICLVSVVFVALALSLFGFYEIRLPGWLENRLTHFSNHQKSGSYIGAAIMGCVASLIISPCVTPPLLGAITYIAQSGNSLQGGLALFAMALGMGIPLLLVGTFGAHCLPRSGAWMVIVKAIFGVLMLMMAIFLLGRILPERITMALWAVLLIISSVYLGLLQPALHNWAKLWRGLGLVLVIYGIILLMGVAQGNTNLFQPLSPGKITLSESTSEFSPVQTRAALNQALAANGDKVTVLDFYAKWCVACKQMDRHTFSDVAVQQALSDMQLLRVDMTSNTPEVEALKKQFNIIAPPTILFFDAEGKEIPGSRVIGDIGAAAFLAKLKQLP